MNELRSDLLNKQIPRLKLYRLNLQEPFNDWRDIAVQWWNQFVDIGHTDKFPALYVFGEADTGKTTFIRKFLMKDIQPCQYYSPTQSTTDFAWNSWDERVHVVSLFEEFRLSNFGEKNRERLKELVAGEGFFAPFKHKNDQMFIKGKIPFIFTSNHSLKETNGFVDSAIASRFLQVNTNGTIFKRVSECFDAYGHMFREEVSI